MGKKTAESFASVKVRTVEDLLRFYPKRYDDRSKTVKFEEAARNAGEKANTLALVLSASMVGKQRQIFKLLLSDGSKRAVLLAFNRTYLATVIEEGDVVYIHAEVKTERSGFLITSFELEKLKKNCSEKDLFEMLLPKKGILPVYRLTEGLKMKIVRSLMKSALTKYLPLIDSELSEEIIKEHGLLEKRSALKNIHFPASLEMLEKARRTIVFEGFFMMRFKMMQKSWEERGHICEVREKETPTDMEKLFSISLSPLQKSLVSSLPFELTREQKKVILEINKDIDKSFHDRCRLLNGEKFSKSPFSAARLVEGDVGSGKTLVALFAVLRAINMGFQCALCCPRELLALQHAHTASNLLSALNVKVAFLSGNTKAKGRSELLKKLKEGEIDLLVGTHALFSEDVEYKDLFLAVIDEQHKFGSAERKALIDKGKKNINGVEISTNYLLMSATPIPQTLALSLFGELDISCITSPPAGRKEIKTFLVKEGNERNAYERVRMELKKGRQSYFVYPAIDKGNERGLKSADEYFMKLQKEIYPEYTCRLIHSKTPLEEAMEAITLFREGKVQILAATTTIEVGIDVANATCIVIEDADCFGLSTLHQLRGRVGRGGEQSFCFLIYSEGISEEGIQRMKIIRENTDGFKIAEEDLRLRGPGELEGAEQSGSLNLPLLNMEKDGKLLLSAYESAKKYFKSRLEKETATESGRQRGS